MLVKQVVNALCGVEQIADRFVVVERVDDVCHVLAHINLRVPLAGLQLGGAVNEVGGEDTGDRAVSVSLVKLVQTVSEQTERVEAEDAVCTYIISNHKHSYI